MTPRSSTHPAGAILAPLVVESTVGFSAALKEHQAFGFVCTKPLNRFQHRFSASVEHHTPREDCDDDLQHDATHGTANGRPRRPGRAIWSEQYLVEWADRRTLGGTGMGLFLYLLQQDYDVTAR